MGASPLLGLPISSLPGLLTPNPNNNTNQLLLFSTDTAFCGAYKSRPAGALQRDGGRVRYSFEDDFEVGGDDLHDDFEFRSGAKHRAWWSDDDDHNDWEIEDDEEPWMFMVLRAFGWMLPAVAISLLFGTGSNAFLMALAVPLGQSVLSLAIDKVWGNNASKSSAKRSRKRPFARAAAARNMRTSQTNEEENVPGERRKNYQSWVGSDTSTDNKGSKSAPRYGGWDDLDKQTESPNPKKAKAPASQKANKSRKRQKKYKFRQIGRVRDRPLLLRLLIAVFPFLGSWTMLLF